MKIWILTAAAVLLLSTATTTSAQDAAPPSEQAPAPARKTSATDMTLGLAYQGPTRLTGSITLMWGEPKMLVAWAPAKLVQVRAGARGAQLGVGLVAGVFEESLIKPSGIAVTLKAVVIRTWRDPSGLTDGNAYAGVESDVVLLGVRGSIGYARRVSGQGGPHGRFIWSLGLGL